MTQMYNPEEFWDSLYPYIFYLSDWNIRIQSDNKVKNKFYELYPKKKSM